MRAALEIHTIPISFELKVNNAKYETINSNATMEITRSEGGGLEMKSRPIKLRVDTTAARDSLGLKTVESAIRDFAKKGVQAAYEATASYVQEGNMMLDIHLSKSIIADIAVRKFSSDVSFNLGFLPSEPADISWDPGELSVRYELDKLNFNWKVNRPEVKFTPGNIEVIIKEYPRVDIEYIGGPIFVPPSADPNYKPIDTTA